MKEKFIKIVRKNGTSLAVNIPSEIVELLKIKEGNMIRAEIEKIENGSK